MFVKMSIPGTNLVFAYDPYQFTALPTWERQFGFVILESRHDGITKILVRKLNPKQLPEKISECFKLDSEAIMRQCGNIHILSYNAGEDFERTIWTGPKSDGARCIIRKDSESWMLSASGPVGDSIKLGQLVDDLNKSIYLSKHVQTDVIVCPVEMRGTLCSIPEGEYTAIIDLLIGPVQQDLHLAVIQIEPNPHRQNLTRIFQGRQLLLYSRTLFQEKTNWGSATVPVGGYVIVQLPRVKLGPDSPLSEGKVIVRGFWDEGQPMVQNLPLQDLRPEITLAWPVPQTWMAINGPDEISIHRLTITIENEHLYASQRGALDLYLPNKQQNANEFQNELELNLDDFPSFGETVRAPCSGQVIRIRSDLQDQLVGVRDRQHPRGNEICIKREDGFVVVLAHLRKGSVLVKEGEYVESGQELAQVGNSGQSSEPHLHIHVADSEDQVADGVVFRFV